MSRPQGSSGIAGIWEELRAHRAAQGGLRIADLMDEQRAAEFAVEAGGLRLDWSKTHVDVVARDLLVGLLWEADVAGRRGAMFAGEAINETEGRAVLHTALRAPEGAVVEAGGRDVMPGVRETLARMRAFASDVIEGRFRGAGGAITDVINIGIGGSDLGPKMAAIALEPYAKGPKVHFVSNVDGADVAGAMAACDPRTTLVIVASKTFTTVETMTNARTARDWMAAAVDDPAAQLAAVSSAARKTAEWGIAEERVFGFEDWVGGRYSVWGPIGLSLMLRIGPKAFDEMLAGGAAMDAHFREAPWAGNLPAVLAMSGLWHNQVCGYATRAVLPYEERLSRLPAYLQQLEMESNGKGVGMDGAPLETDSGPVVWGEPGTNGQHAFYQLIHQGTRTVPCEFMAGREGHELPDQHRLLVANCLAQAEALMLGRTLDQARESLAGQFEGEELERQAAHRAFPGDRPSVTLLYPKLTPFVLGQIVALYEHRVFVEGAVLGINSFDQWGVELGKELATAMTPILAGEASAAGKDASTRAAVGWLRG